MILQGSMKICLNAKRSISRIENFDTLFAIKKEGGDCPLFLCVNAFQMYLFIVGKNSIIFFIFLNFNLHKSLRCAFFIFKHSEG